MNEKQAKLVRYFVKYTRDLKLGAEIKTVWPHMNHKMKGRTARWMKRVIVTIMGLNDQAKKAKLLSNLEVLKGFEV